MCCLFYFVPPLHYYKWEILAFQDSSPSPPPTDFPLVVVFFRPFFFDFLGGPDTRPSVDPYPSSPVPTSFPQIKPPTGQLVGWLVDVPGRKWTDQWLANGLFHLFTLPETNSSPLKMVVSNTNLLFQWSIFRGELLVSGRVQMGVFWGNLPTDPNLWS